MTQFYPAFVNIHKGKGRREDILPIFNPDALRHTLYQLGLPCTQFAVAAGKGRRPCAAFPMCSPMAMVSEGLFDVNSIRSIPYVTNCLSESGNQVSCQQVHVCPLFRPRVGDIAVEVGAKDRGLHHRIALAYEAAYEPRQHISRSPFRQGGIPRGVDVDVAAWREGDV